MFAAIAFALALFTQTAQPPDDLWTPDCQYLPLDDNASWASSYNVSAHTIVQCEDFVWAFLDEGRIFVSTDGDDYFIPLEQISGPLNIATYGYSLIWVDTAVHTICGANFGSHIGSVACTSPMVVT